MHVQVHQYAQPTEHKHPQGQPALLPALLEGVGAHLESPLEAVRLRGMRVGEAFARVMGQPLRFDELDGRREGDGEWEEEEYDSRSAGADDGGGGDPVEGDDEGEEEELQLYDLSDDEADLLPVARPTYLQRIVECASMR